MAVITRVVNLLMFQRILQGETVQHGSNHAHIVAGGAVHAFAAGGESTEDIAAADDNGDFHAAIPSFFNLAGN